MMKTNSTISFGLIAPAMLLTGCAAISGSDALSLRSKPPAAEVYVMGRLVGKTPVTISQQTLYPSTYPQDKQHLYGEITIKKAGCQDYRRRISSHDIAYGVEAELDCGGNASSDQSNAVAPSMPNNENAAPDSTAAAAPPTPAGEGTGRSVKQRLQQINELRDAGLIDEQEYHALRQRILDTL